MSPTSEPNNFVSILHWAQHTGLLPISLKSVLESERNLEIIHFRSNKRKHLQRPDRSFQVRGIEPGWGLGQTADLRLILKQWSLFGWSLWVRGTLWLSSLPFLKRSQKSMILCEVTHWVSFFETSGTQIQNVSKHLPPRSSSHKETETITWSPTGSGVLGSVGTASGKLSLTPKPGAAVTSTMNETEAPREQRPAQDHKGPMFPWLTRVPGIRVPWPRRGSDL